ncbi:MAG: ABC transporter substrate-binding protein [Candidatus Paceibacterota bacterium]|jgi:putative ABC transport system substrate-binding protein
MTKKIIILIAVVVVILAAGAYCFLAQEESEKTYRIGILAGVEVITPIADSFKAEMAELGYIEGENIAYDIQVTNIEPDKEKEILQGFVDSGVDLIFTFPTEVSMFAKEIAENTGIPVLFAFANIEDTGLVDNITNPGGNITGVRYPGPDLIVKRLEIMEDLIPGIKAIWVPYQKDYPIVPSQLEVLRPAALEAGITLIEFPGSGGEDLQAELDRLSELENIGIDAILSLADPYAIVPEFFMPIAKFATENSILMGGNYMSVGGYESIFGVTVNLETTGQQAAAQANKILSGVPAGTIPVVSSENYFVFSYRGAEALGIDIPVGLLSQADEIIR